MSADERPIVIVGGGPAAHSCIEAYRDAGGAAPLVLATSDDRLPYYRPALTKEFLRGEQASVELGLADEGWYADRHVTIFREVAAHSLDPGDHTVVIGDELVGYRACVLATGSTAAPLPVPGGDDPEVLSIRRAADAERVVAALAGVHRVIVIGSGFVGCEAAASLRARGKDVVMVTDEPVPQARRLGEQVGSFVLHWLVEAGVEMVTGSGVERIEHDSSGWRVVTGAGIVEVDLVIAATGAKPELSVARGAGLEIEEAVLVDAAMHTSTPDVLAIGDIAEAWHPVAGRRLRVEHWGDALGMGAVAGSVLAGHPAQWTDVPGFWSTIGDRTLKHASWGGPWDAVEVVLDDSGFTAWYGTEGLLTGVLTHGHDDDYERGRNLVAGRVPFTRS